MYNLLIKCIYLYTINPINNKAMKQKIAANRETGSFINYMMGNNSSLPEVGKGATILHWTDRSAYEVIEVFADRSECTIQRYKPERVDNYGMSDCQIYKYEQLTGEKMRLAYRRGAWRQLFDEITFTDEFIKNADCEFYVKCLTPEQKEEIFQGECWPQKVVPGITRIRHTSKKVHVIFGTKDEHYDYSF